MESEPQPQEMLLCVGGLDEHADSSLWFREQRRGGARVLLGLSPQGRTPIRVQLMSSGPEPKSFTRLALADA